MQDSHLLLKEIRAIGVQAFAGVPCSILNPITNLLKTQDDVHYVAASVEGEAVAYAAGVWLGGGLGAVVMQNSGLGNAVNPLMSLAIPYRIPMLLLVSWRGEPGRPDAHHHLPMGAITPELFELMGIPSFIIREDSDVASLVSQAADIMTETRSPVALVLPRGIYRKSSPSEQIDQLDAAPRTTTNASPSFDGGEPPTRLQVVEALESCKDALKIATTGYMGRTLFGHGHADNQFYMQGSMGFALAIGLGLAETRMRDRVFVLDGDGAMIMRLGSLATVGWRAPHNLMHLVLDNHCYQSTGGQPSAAPGVNFPAVALACGYRRAATVTGAQGLAPAFDWLASEPGPTLVHIVISQIEATDLPRPSFEPADIATCLHRYVQIR